MTITELEKASGVPRRTVHFYIRQGVLPPPDGAGGAARYGEEHLLRLRLIQELQKSHLKLAGIREALDAMSIEEMRALAEWQGREDAAWDPETLHHWLREGRFLSVAEDEIPGFLRDEGVRYRRKNAGVALPSGDAESAALPQHGNLLKNLRRQPALEEESWTRFRPAEGVELQVRGELLRERRREILAWLAELDRILSRGR